MARTLLLAISILLAAAGFSRAQTEPAGKKPADPRDELRYDGKPFAYWESFGRNELKAERRIEAIRALAAFGSRGYAKEATAAIVELLKDYDNDVSAFNYDESKPELMTPDQRVIKEILWALGKIGPDASPGVLAKLDRPAVLRAAGELYQERSYHPRTRIGAAAVPILVGFLDAKNEQIRWSATAILAMGLADEKEEKGKDYKAALVSAIEKSAKEKAIIDALLLDIDSNAAPILGVLGPRAKAAVPALVRAEAVSGSDCYRDALAQIKPTNAERLQALLAEFKDDGGYRGEAAAAIAKIGEDAGVAIPDLLAEIKKPLREKAPNRNGDDLYKERLAVLDSFIQLAGSKEALSVVAELLDKNDSPIRERDLLRFYLKLETDGKKATPVLTRSLVRLTGDPKFNPSVQNDWQSFRQIVDAIGAQGEHAGSAVPLLVNVHDKAPPYDQRAIIATLGKIGPAASDALPMLSRSLQSQDADIRRAAAEAIQAITMKK